MLTDTSDGAASSRGTVYKFLLYPISASSASSFTTVLLEILRAKGGPGFEHGTRSRGGSRKNGFYSLKGNFSNGEHQSVRDYFFCTFFLYLLCDQNENSKIKLIEVWKI